jgi:ubiquinone biosynthesis monooxygenase Coq7
MQPRHLNLLDRCLIEVGHALRTVAAKPRAVQPRPDVRNEVHGEAATDAATETSNPTLSASLMRVNHSGEVAAQALYRGQALVARDSQLRAELLQAAGEEQDHLAWCQERTEELGGRTSVLAPVWFAGSFALGIVAGLAGDRISLGFLAETEKQVAEHLDGHLQELPPDDTRSRDIVKQMRADEVEHGAHARALGGTDLPRPLEAAMRLTAKIMTTASRRL